MARTVSIGTEFFYKLRERNAFLVDKTGFIREWWNDEAEVTLITRPRRFGKTLTMSMVECFFSTWFAGRGDLFEGLNVWEDEELRNLQGTIPVINISLKNAKSTSYEVMQSALGREISKAYEQHGCLLESERLTEKQKNRIQEMMDFAEDMPEKKIRGAMEDLSRFLYLHYGEKPIILIDEYDAPLLSAYLSGYFSQAIELIRGVFAGALKTNDCLGRAILTGITRISMESLFSDLNNLKTAGMLDNAYADCLGFTEEEVMDALEEFGLSDRKESVRNWYDGYTIGNKSEIYNPWAVTKYLDSGGELRSYWSNTSGNDLIRQLLMSGEAEVKQKFEELLRGGSIEADIRENVVFQELDQMDNEDAVWSLLLSTGYLRVTESACGEYGNVIGYRLKITNMEIREAMKMLVKDWFRQRTVKYSRFVKALLENNLEEMNTYLSEVLQNCMSYHDGGRNMGVEQIRDRPERKTPENFYHGLVLGMLVDLQGRYDLTSNRESGNGRYDIMLEPLEEVRRPSPTVLSAQEVHIVWTDKADRTDKATQTDKAVRVDKAVQVDKADRTDKTVQTAAPIGESDRRSRTITAPAYIIEFKVQNEAAEKSLEETADNALRQITEKGYETALLAKGIAKERIFMYGMAFNGKAALVKLGK